MNVAKGQAKQIAYFLMNPMGTRPMRMNHTFDSAATSALTLSSFTTLVAPAFAGNYVTAGIGVASGFTQVFYFRDPLRAFVYLLPYQVPYVYTAQFPQQSGITSLTDPLPPQNSAVSLIVPIYFSNTSGSSPHGTTLFCGNDPDSSIEGYFWMDFGSFSTVTQTTYAAGDTVEWRAYDGGQDTLITTATFSGSNPAVTYTLVASGGRLDLTRGSYVRLLYFNGATPNAAQTLTITLGSTAANLDVFSHQSVPNAIGHLANFQTARVNSVSFLLKNCAAEVYKEGTLQAASFTSSTQWNTYVGNKNIYNTVGVRNAWNDRLARGSYSFLHVGDMEDFKFKNYVTMSATAAHPMSCSFPLSASRFVTISCQDINIGTITNPNFPGIDFDYCATHSIEFQTNDQWYNAVVPSMDHSAMDAAYEIVKHETQFFENPDHLARIAAYLGGLGRSLRTHAGKIGGALSALFPQYAGAFGAVAAALS
jgi:hypothetical protein